MMRSAIPLPTPILRPALATALAVALPCLALTASALSGQQSADLQITEAVQAAPAAEREDATVLGYGADGTLTTLREGSNALVCLADDPAAEGWSVACYHASLEPYMARGRELRAQGITDASERLRLRWQEAEAGTLAMPDEPATLYVLTGEGFDHAADAVEAGYLRWVIYTPWATAEETGLATTPAAPGAPWLMFPGTPGAHIMISPPPPPGGPGR
jgi:hypothetical protein